MSAPDLSAKLPPPHDEEPAQLRSDILDELQDHLSCAAEREQRRQQLGDQPTDQASIWTAVIDRFGDPSALARRLWFDAMKGRLMTQRVLLGAVGILSILVGLLVWRVFYIPQPFIDEKKMTAILEQLRKEAPASVSPEWNSVKYRLVQGTKDGPPVVGQQVSFQQLLTNGPGRLNHISEITDSEGVADFGLLPYGTYNLSISSSAGMMGESVTLRPGRPIDTKIVVPHPPEMVHVKFEYIPPDMSNWKWNDNKELIVKLDPCLCIQYRPKNNIEIDGIKWGLSESSGCVIIGPEGIFNIRKKSTQERIIVSSAAVDFLVMPAVEMEIQAEWYFLGGNPVDEIGSKINEAFYLPMTALLDTEFVAENRNRAQSTPEPMPINITIKSNPSPQLIRIPSNHPGLVDGTGITFAPYFGGFGGFGP